MSTQDSQNPDPPGEDDAPDLSKISNWDEFDAMEARRAAEANEPPKRSTTSVGGIEDFNVDDLNFGQLPDDVKAQLEGRPTTTSTTGWGSEGWGSEGWGSPVVSASTSNSNQAANHEDLALVPSKRSTSNAETADPRSSQRSPAEGASPLPSPSALEDIEAGKGMAVLSHLSYFSLLPLFAIPMLVSDNPFALHHARQAGAAWIALVGVQMVAVGVTMVTCGLFPMLMFLPFVMTVMLTVFGVIWSIRGEAKHFPILEKTGDRLFAKVKASKQLR